MNILIDIVAGARPNFIKISPIIRELELRKKAGGHLNYRLIHTGQHYHDSMSGHFFRDLGIPSPDINLEVGSGSHAEQTAAIMLRYEKLLQSAPSALCLVVGDVTSTMACAITAQKLCIPVAHVEAGIRSGDWRMPEEINRMVTDSITNWFFTTSNYANANLKEAGISEDRIFFVGNTMIDTLIYNRSNFRAPDLFTHFNLRKGHYFVLTMHRPNNVDESEGFLRKITAVANATRGLPIVFPAHPRTAQRIKEIGKLPPQIHLVEPQPYLEFNYLVENAFAVITDSGGITEETTVMGIPCLTLRDNTERPETVTLGTNELIGTDPAAIGPALDLLFSGEWKNGTIPEKWDGQAALRIVTALEKLLPYPF